jgi:hypothetical protein
MSERVLRSAGAGAGVANGLSLPLDSFDVSLVHGESARILRHGDTAGDCCGWSLSSIASLPTGYVGAVAFEEERAQYSAAAAFPPLSGRFPGEYGL